MDSTHVSAYFKESATDETVVVLDGPCVLKGVTFSPGLASNPDGLIKEYIQMLDGSEELFKLYSGAYPAYGGVPVHVPMPALGVRIDDSLEFSVPSGSTLHYITILYQ